MFSASPLRPSIRTIRWLLHQGAILYPLRTHTLHSKGVQTKEALGSPNDPLFPQQWYLVNRRHPRRDLNVRPVWKRGIRGKGVVVGLIDDGVDDEHDDLIESFRTDLSYDFNEDKLLPVPSKSNQDYHGTRCAGQIVSKPNNGVCGVGIAPEAQVSAIRILSGIISSKNEAAAVIHKYHENHIYSCSWGPADDGKAIDAPDKLVLHNFIRGLVHGRSGKGSIYVFAAGNGRSVDHCNYDGYANGMFAVTVGAVDVEDRSPPYMEPCSAQLVCAYSSNDEYRIATTELGNRCTTRHGGTSAAAPMVAGVVALALSARPDLSWRDVRHILVHTAIPFRMDADPSWVRNGAGRWYSYKFGFGKVDAAKVVDAALAWKSVGRPVVRSLPLRPVHRPIQKGIPATDSLHLADHIIKAAGLDDIGMLENVTVKLYIRHTRRGDLQVRLTSPAGTTVVLASSRPQDDSAAGLDGWTMMTPAFWGEGISGEWRLEVRNAPGTTSTGELLQYRISFWGGLARHVQETDEQYSQMFLADYYPPHPDHFVDRAGLWKAMEAGRRAGEAPVQISKRPLAHRLLIFVCGLAIACLAWRVWSARQDRSSVAGSVSFVSS